MSLSQNQSTKYDSSDRLRLLSSVFSKEGEWIASRPTGNPVYDAVAAYADYLRIPIVGYQSMLSAYGEDFTCRQVARASHIAARLIHLQDGWNHSTSYPFIGFYGEDQHPVLCIPDELRSFTAYDPTNRNKFKIKNDNARDFADQGVIFCRPLPRRSLELKDLFSYAKHYVSGIDLFNMCFMILVSTLVGLLLPILNEQLFDKLIPMGSFNAIMQIGVVILACSLGNMLFLAVKNISSLRAISRAKYSLMDATFERIFNLPQNFIDKFGSVDLVTRTTGMMESLVAVSTSVMSAGIGVVLSILYLIRMFRKSSKLSWAALIMLVIGAAIAYAFGYSKKKYIVEAEKENCKSRNSLYNFISGIMKVRLSGMEEKAIYDYQTSNVKVVRNEMKVGYIEAWSGTCSVLTSAFSSIILYYLVMKKGIDISIGEFTAFTSAFGLFNSAVMQFVTLIVTLPTVKPSIDRAMPIFETACENTQSGSIITKLEGNVEADHLSFRYDKEEKNVIDDISFQIKSGEYVGIVGSSGCGKSTLFKLLLGFEQPTSGNIYYDDKGLDMLDKTELRRQMGVVLQDGRMTSGTIYENVAIASPGISQERVKELLIEAGMEYDLDRMPMGILTEVSEFGGSISGGQQQRILIARALANDPCILLFDEATSALDNGAQNILCNTLAKRNITRIVIAHRLNTVEKCDRILVMDEGKIVEEGSFDELAKAGGLFSRMIKEQALIYEENRELIDSIKDSKK